MFEKYKDACGYGHMKLVLIESQTGSSNGGGSSSEKKRK
jgi:hypothetical protein